MKMLENKALIYDSNCPLCCWYTDKFIQIGALPENGRISFNELNEKNKSHLDEHKSRHQIPLLDTKTGNVVYGIDGLTLILANYFPFFEKILTNTFCKKMVQPLYSFISYNRRIIVPTKVSENQKNYCAPDFHFGWRLSLIIICWSFFYALVFNLNIQLSVYGINLFLLFPILHLAFILFIAKGNYKHKLWNVLGDFAVTNLSTTLLFFPLFIISYFIPQIPKLINVIVFVLFQLRLMVHFIKRMENKNYLS
jgi:predicted DCC family thiol-disulfide oxidoreductase YuxK